MPPSHAAAPPSPTDDPLLLPTPVSVTRTGRVVNVSPGVVEYLDGFLVEPVHRTVFEQHAELTLSVHAHGAPHPQGYRLVVDLAEKHVGSRERDVHLLIEASTPVGLRSGALTLRQLLRRFGTQLPGLVIEDQPAFATRGVMLDVSRDKVPTMASLLATVDLLASLKFNHLQLYTEHTFAYEGHQDVWRDASPITPAEAIELDTYCAARGIELAANQNCFGHLASWLRRPAYRHLAEIPSDDHVWRFLRFERKGPFSLCPVEPAAAAFVRDLLSQLLPCFRCGLVNIGCDETFDVGWGRSKAEVERRGGGEAGRADLYAEFAAGVVETARSLGKRSMFWADIALSHPECLGRIPRDAVGLAWGYEPDAAFGAWCDTLRAAGHEAWVCPGTSSWRTFTGRTTERRGNLVAAGTQGAAHGASGFLVCDWGDLGHRQHWPIAVAGLAHAAEAAWNPSAAARFDPRATSAHALGDESLLLGPWLDRLGDVDAGVRAAAGVRNASAIFNDLHPPVPPKGTERSVNASLEQFESVLPGLAEAERTMPVVKDPLVAAELAHALACARLAAEHAVAARRTPPFPEPERSRLLDTARDVLHEHRRLWVERNRPGGLEHSASFYQRVIDDLGARRLRACPPATPSAA